MQKETIPHATEMSFYPAEFSLCLYITNALSILNPICWKVTPFEYIQGGKHSFSGCNLHAVEDDELQ